MEHDTKERGLKSVIQADVLSNSQITPGIYGMELYCGDVVCDIKPGHFAMVYTGLGERILPRPISICDCDLNAGTIRLIYKIAGIGTAHFAVLEPGARLRVNLPLGNGFATGDYKSVAIVGGGVGIPPLLGLVKTIRETSPESRVTAFLGYRSKPYLHEDFTQAGVAVNIATDDGSYGFKGNAVELLESVVQTKNEGYDMIYACGPKPMLKALDRLAGDARIPVQLSFEERMACGVGACVGCAVKIKDRNSANGFIYKKVCKDGPVFLGGEVMFDE